MKSKIIPIISPGFSTRYFSIPIREEDLSEKPHLRISSHMNASFALSMGDNGLERLGIRQGDYLLFSIINLLNTNEQLSLVWNEEDEYIIRDRVMPTDHIRIIAILDHVIKPYEDLTIVYFQ